MSDPESYSDQTDRTPPPSAAAQRFASAIEQHDRRSAASDTELRDAAACAYVAELKTESLPPERVLVQIKALLRECLERTDDAEDKQRQILLQKVITWCIEAYYGGANQAHRDRQRADDGR